MLKRWRLFWIEIILILLLVGGAIAYFPLSQTNTNAEQEKTRLETRLRATQLNLNELEQAPSVSTEKLFHNQAETIAVTSQIMEYAENNKVNITRWDFSYTTTTLEARQYSAIRHNLFADGTTNALTGFVEALPHSLVAPVIKNMNTTQVEEGGNIWRINLELLVYYR